MKAQASSTNRARFTWLWSPQTVWLLAGIIILVAFALRLHDLGGESLWYDELLQLDIAQGNIPSIFAKLKRHSALPLDYLISHAWLWGGRSQAWVRIPALFFGMLGLPMIYQLGRRLVDPYVGLLAMTFLALSPLHFYYSQEVRPYTLVVFGVGMAGYAYWQLRTTERWRYFVLLQIGILLFGLAHFFALTILLPWGIIAGLDLLFSRKRAAAAKALGGLVVGGVTLLILLWLMGYGNTVYHSSTNFGEALVEPEKFSAEPEEKPNKGTGPQVNETFIQDRILKPIGIRSDMTALWVFNGLVIIGILWLFVQRQFKLALLLTTWIIIPIVGIIAFLVFRGTFYAPRYIMAVLPAYFLLAAVGLLALPRWLRRIEARWLPLIGFLLIGGYIGWYLMVDIDRLNRFRDKENWALVHDFLAQNAKPEDALIFPNADPVYNWYWPSHQVDPDYFDRLPDIETMVADADRSWVVMSIFSDALDDSGRIKAWLSEQGAIRLVLDPVITVYYLGYTASPERLLEEIQGFALPVNHALYASLARENRRNPEVARQYYQLAIDNAPDEQTQAAYQTALDALSP